MAGLRRGAAPAARRRIRRRSHRPALCRVALDSAETRAWYIEVTAEAKVHRPSSGWDRSACPHPSVCPSAQLPDATDGTLSSSGLSVPRELEAGLVGSPQRSVAPDGSTPSRGVDLR